MAAKPRPVYAPAAGLKSDFEKLFTLYTGTKSVRYEDFNKIWIDGKMPLIFSGRQTDRECREFTEECMRLGVEFWMPPYSFQVRVGGLYLLYGLYFKQPCKPKVKIRITLPQWKEVIGFLGEVKKQQHLDVEYIFHRLRFDKAFHFTGMPKEMGMKYKDLTDDQSTTAAAASKSDNLTEQKSILSEILEPDNIDQLSAIHDQYQRMKCKLSGENRTTPQASLDVINSGLVQYITKAVATHEEWRRTKAGKKGTRRRRDSGATTTSESEVESDIDSWAGSPVSSPKKGSATIGSKRAEIKAKAFAAGGTLSRSRRHRKTKKDIVLSPDGTGSGEVSVSPPRRKKRKKIGSGQSTSEAHSALFSPKSTQQEPEAVVIEPQMKTVEAPEGLGTHLRNTLLSMPMLSTDEDVPVKEKKPRKKPQGRGRSRPTKTTDEAEKVGQGQGRGRGRPRKSPGSPVKPKTSKKKAADDTLTLKFKFESPKQAKRMKVKKEKSDPAEKRSKDDGANNDEASSTSKGKSVPGKAKPKNTKKKKVPTATLR